MSDFFIRQYQQSDHASVLHLHALAMQKAGGFLNDSSLDQDLLDIKSNYLLNKGEFLVGLLDSKIVAMGAFRYVDEITAEIKRMRVHPNYQRKGFGQKILSVLEKGQRKMAIKNLF